MIEVAFCYDFLPNIDEKSYAKMAREATSLMLKADGFIELHANRNLIGSPHVRRTSVWKSFAHYAKFVETPEFQKITHDFRMYVTNIDVQFWGKSPLVPDPIRPDNY